VKNCLKNKRFLYILLLVSLVGFLVLPKICLADNSDNIYLEKMGKYLELPSGDAQKLIDTLRQVLTTEGIFLWSSGEVTEEKTAAGVILLNVVKVEILNHLLVDAPIEITWKIIKTAVKIVEIYLTKDISKVIEELEKESVKKANEYAMGYLFQNEIRVTPGAIKFKYPSKYSGQKEVIFQYVIIYRPIDIKKGEVEIRFYMPDSIEPPDPNKFSKFLKVPDLQYNLPPFMVEIKGIVEKNEFGNYRWINEKGEISHPSVNITFPPEVPDLGIKPLSTWEKYVLKPIDTVIKEVEIIITKATGKSVPLTKIWNEIKAFLAKIKLPGQAAVVKETETAEVGAPQAEPRQAEFQKEEEPPAEIGQGVGQGVGNVEVNPQSIPSQKLTLEEIQEKLDDIAKRVDAVNQKVKDLVGEEKVPEEEKEEKKKEEKEKEKKEISLCERKGTPLRDKVIINEVAWMGTSASYNDEWIELKNISGSEINLSGWQLLDKDQQIKIIFDNQHRVLVNGFWLLERTDDDSVPGIAADLIYTGGLKNSDEALYLFDENCQLQDEVLANPDWPAGDNNSKRTMERKNDLSWQTSANPGGTPKAANSEGYYGHSIDSSSSSGSSSGGSSLLSLDTQPPIANAGPDQTVIINQAVTFDGSQSSDNVKIVSYQWDINQDGQWDLDGEKVTYKNGYQIPGEYNVTLRVSDKAGNFAADTLIITVIQPPKILISEIQIDTTISSSYDFVELYNPNNFDIDISGFQLKKKASTGSETSIRVFPTGNKILAQSYFLWTNSNYALSGLISADATSTQTLAKNNSLALFDKNRNLLDAVAWGSSTNPFVESSPFSQNPGKDQGLGRKWIEGTGYQDTDNNSVDFEIQSPTPKAKNETFRDIIPPETTILNKPSSLTNQTQAIFTFSSSEENSTFECKIDEENWQICFSPQQYSNLLDGLHTFQVKAKDISQNTDPIPAQYQWKIDTIPPQTEILTFPPSLTNQIQATFTFSSNEKNSTFECELKKLTESGSLSIYDWESCSSPKVYQCLTDGEYTFSVRAKDLAGNLESNPPEYTWKIDTEIESPFLSLADLDSDSFFYTNATTVKVIISNDEDASAWLLSETQIKPEANSSDWRTTKPSIFTLSEENGPKTVYIWTKDGAGNIAQGISASIVLDTALPQIEITSQPANPTNQTQATFNFSSNENSTFQCQLDSLDWQDCSSPSTFNNLIEDSHIFQVKAIDLAGNISETLSYFWTIDLTSPEVNFQEISSPQTQTSFPISWIGEGKFQFRYSDDETNWTYYPSENEYNSTTEYQFTGEDETTYYFQIRAKDEAGNESEWQEILIKISLPKPILEVDKDSLEFEGTEFGLNPEQNSLIISNSGQADLEWEIVVFPEVSWLTIESISGQILPDNCSEISVSVNISDLCSGQYLTKISISSNGGSKEIETVLKLEEDNIPPANADLVLADLANESNFYTQNRIVKVAITNDQDASFWLLSENQTKPEANDLNWQNVRPSEFTLSSGDGSKTVYIWTKDKAGNISELGKYASIILDTTPPIARAGEDRTVEINQPITLDASGSSDNTEITSFKWDIDDSDGLNWEEPNLVGETVTFEGGYSELGSYTVTLQVSDGVGNLATDSLVVTVVEPQPTLEVVINEIAWMGTKASSADEWIEFYNNTENEVSLSGWKLISSDESGPLINFKENHKIGSKNYFLIERTNDTATSELADWTGPFGNGLGNNPNCEILFLYDSNDNLIDQTGCKENGYWFAGDNDTKQTMERINSNESGSDSTNWENNNLITKNGYDAGNPANKINGTPKAKNSVSTSPTTISSLPFDEFSEITLTFLGNPYIVKGELAIPRGKTLTIEPGVVIKFYDVYSGMIIDGTLKAIGGETDDKKIVFTSYRDNPQPGDWKQIYFSQTSTDSELINVRVEYGGEWSISGSCYADRAAVRVKNSSIVLKDSILENNESRGLYLINSSSTIERVQFLNHQNGCGDPGTYVYGNVIALWIDEGGRSTITSSTFRGNITGIVVENGASPVIENNLFEKNQKPIWVHNSYPSFKNNQATNNNLNGILIFDSNIAKDTTWQADLPYIIEYTLTILPDVTLTLNPGVVIKFLSGYSGMTVNGTLKAIGNPDEKIVFTSYKDADYGGSGGAGAGNWKQIYFSSSRTNSELDNVIVRYGGAWPSDSECPLEMAAIRVEQTSITLENSRVENNIGRGAYLINSSATLIDNVQFFNNISCQNWLRYSYYGTGVSIDGGSPTIKNSTFKNNYYGIYIQSGEPTLDLESLTFGTGEEKNNCNIYKNGECINKSP
jgi:hypothetical protein